MTPSPPSPPSTPSDRSDPSGLAREFTRSVNDFIAAHPETFPVFMEYGVETCCGGSMRVADVVTAYGIPEPELIKALRQAIEHADVRSPRP